MINNDKFKKLLFLLCPFFVFPIFVFAADVSITPASQNVSPSSRFTISVNINNVSNLFGAAFDLIFDPNVLEFVSTKEGNFLGSDGVSTWLNTAVSSEGLIVGYSRIAQAGIPTGISGSGTLMTLTFEALAEGTSTLNFQNNHLLDPEIEEIATNWKDGAVIVKNPPVCASFVYSDWNECQPDNAQTRTIISSLPTGCLGGNPIILQSCDYAPPSSPLPTGNRNRMPGDVLTLTTIVQESVIDMIKGEISQSTAATILVIGLISILFWMLLKEIRDIIKKQK